MGLIKVPFFLQGVELVADGGRAQAVAVDLNDFLGGNGLFSADVAVHHLHQDLGPPPPH
jgi:hypothetical protein